jgi:hypothetical protein
MLAFAVPAAGLRGSSDSGVPAAAAPAAAPAPAAIDAALEVLRHDPNLGTESTVKSLRWVTQSAQKPQALDAPAWIVGLFKFITQGAQLLIWIAGAIGLAIAAIWACRTYRTRQSGASSAVPAAPIIQALDIRPESLPDDVGGAALVLLEAGRSREALSLLYRGALSRAVHRFAAAISESFTEGEALRAVSRLMPPAGVRYFSGLLATWQRAVYAAEPPPAESVAELCRGFAVLDGPMNEAI